MNFLLPLEISSRELMAKLFMAHQFAMDGHISYVGEKSNILSLSKYISPAIYFDKGYHRGVSEKNYAILKKRGVVIVSLDEENAVDFKDLQQLNLRFPDEILDEFGLIFLWGTKQYDFLSKNRSSFNSKKIVVSGHPRFELLKNKFQELYANDVVNYREKFGDFILINTNFGLGNNLKSEAEVVSNYVQRFPQIKELINYQKLQVANFVALAKFLNKKTKSSIVLRPHPEESLEIYLREFKDYPNIHVVYEGSVIPWIIASKVMVHHDCTTSLEAAMLGRNSIAFTKNIDQQLTTDIPLKISYICERPSEVSDLIISGLNNLYINEEILRSYFTFHDNSIDLIKDKLRETFKLNKSYQKKLYVFKIQSKARSIYRFFLKKESSLFKQKFQGFNIKEAKRIIDVLNSIYSASVKINFINKQLIEVYWK